jgi:hypothetical protein
MAVSLELAIAAIKAGRKQEGRQLLNLLIQQDPNSEMAWLWMSSVVDTDEQRARCLYHVLSINPRNDLAQRGLKKLGIDISDSRPVKIPSESKPIHIPVPSTASTPPGNSIPNGSPPLETTPGQPDRGEERRPFLINPQTISAELPFTPVNPPFEAEPAIQASPEILSLKVDDEAEESAAPAEATPRAPEVETSTLAGAVAASLAAGGVVAVATTSPEAENKITAAEPVPTAQNLEPAEPADTAPAAVAGQQPAVETETQAMPAAETADRPVDMPAGHVSEEMAVAGNDNVPPAQPAQPAPPADQPETAPAQEQAQPAAAFCPTPNDPKVGAGAG